MELSRKRLFINKKISEKEREKTIRLAVENGCNTLVFSMDDRFFKKENSKYAGLIKNYSLNTEAGGRDLPLLLPKRKFFFNSGLFRMTQGIRKPDHHFCPTNPKTIALLSERCKIFFDRVMEKVSVPRVFHLLPDKGHENTWCACPACRAFRPAEQYMIAVNAAADILAACDPDALLLYIDFDTAPQDAPRLALRKNTLKLLEASLQAGD